jgi:THO complex subunit 1
MDELQRRLQRRGSDDEETIQKRLVIAQQELEQAKAEGFHDKVFVNDDLETTYKQLENYIFGVEENNEDSSQLTSRDEKTKSAEPANAEVEMVEIETPAPEEFSKNDVSGAAIAKAPIGDSTGETIMAGETS